MLTASIPRTVRNSDLIKSEPDYLIRLRKALIDKDSIIKLSMAFGIKPSHLKKISAGHSISRYLNKKICKKLENWPDRNEKLLESPKVQRILSVHQRYQEIGTLAGVGRELGLSRERIRQIIKGGALLGLFEYHKPVKLDLIPLSKKKIMDDYRNLLQFQLVAKNNDISIYQLNRLIKRHRITTIQLQTVRKEGNQIKSILHYFSFVRKLGHHPLTSELQKTNEGRYLSYKISKLWGSIHAFRKDLRIPFSPVRKEKGIL